MLNVDAAIIEQGDKILIAKRAPGKHLAGYWEFPGDKIESNETPQDCLARELYEELNVRINVGRFVGISEYKYDTKFIKLQAFICQIVSGEMILKDHDKIKWIRLSEIHQFNIAPADKPLIQLYDKARNH